ncbi:MAG: hypothetical protein VZR09_01735 [Candidatus Gastranaerophilaceae bacterium]|nr:hypothetical protein [Candidatus Gastranaerophilaceae bacterium]
MSDLKVESKVQVNKPNLNQVKNENQDKNSQPEVKDAKISKSAKYMIGATALAATIALGVIGHKNNWWRNAEKESKNLVDDVQETLTEMTAEAFEKAGNKIEKGIAKLSDGTLYSGKITTNTNSGNGMVLEYKNGKLNSAKKLDGEKVIYTKSYTYDDDGVLTDVWKSYFDAAQNASNNTRIYMHNPCYIRDKGLIIKNISGNQFIQDAKTGKILRNRGKDYFYNPDGSLNCTKDAANVPPDRAVQLPEQ